MQFHLEQVQVLLVMEELHLLEDKVAVGSDGASALNTAAAGGNGVSVSSSTLIEAGRDLTVTGIWWKRWKWWSRWKRWNGRHWRYSSKWTRWR